MTIRISRRTLLKLSMLLAASTLLPGCDDEPAGQPSEEPAEPDAPTAQQEDQPMTGTATEADVIVIGAGMSGVAAARELTRRGYQVIVLEGRDRIGGRTWTENSALGVPVDLGASWIHGVKGNPLTDLAEEFDVQTIPTDYDNMERYNTDGWMMYDDSEHVDELFEALMERVEARREELDEDTSLQAVIDSVLADMDLTDDERRQIAYAVNTIIEHDYGGASTDLSVWWYDDSDEFGGEDVLFPGGYVQIVDAVARGLDIRLSHIVQRIENGKDGVSVITDRGTFEADYAVVTLPLGVLRKGSVIFDPLLPESKQRAINNLHMGVLNKVYLRFPQIFWDAEAEVLGYIGERRGLFAEWFDYSRVSGQPILLGFNAADVGVEIEGWSDEQIVAEALNALQDMYPDEDIPQPEAWLITRWMSDPFAYGSYSHTPPGATTEDYGRLAEPVGDRLYFAGEATHSEYPQTVHGAYLSGIRAAEEIDA